MAVKLFHEIRDPIHNFVRLDSDERLVLDSRPIQRLRQIHQLAMSYLVYPGATHKRFEHSLGVMELAGRVFDVITADHNIHSTVREVVPEIAKSDSRDYWRKVLRMAALCHDIGHLPFSHAAEKELLPDGRDHEHITADLIRGSKLIDVWQSMTPPLKPDHIAKVAVGPEKMQNVEFSNWEILLSEIIGNDALGVDRMDYLLRDSHHVGVAYGRFDHYRLIDTMRVLPASQQSDEPTLGVESGGLHSAEALLLARYFMFMQVYHHHVRTAYDLHLQQFLRLWLPCGRFPTEAEKLQSITDVEILSALSKAAADTSAAGHEAANRIVKRKHFQRLYSQTLSDKALHENPLAAISMAVEKRYGEEQVLTKSYRQTEPTSTFPVRNSDDTIVSSHTISEALQRIPLVDVGVVLIAPGLADEARRWLREHKDAILVEPRVEVDHGS